MDGSPVRWEVERGHIDLPSYHGFGQILGDECGRVYACCLSPGKR